MKENIDFRNANDWQNNSIIRRDQTNEWIFYVEGYRIAAEKLINEVLATQENRYTLIYPIVFLYRHYIEIQFKEIIQIGRRYLNETEKLKIIHDLLELWKIAKEIISKIWSNESENNTTVQVEKIIKSICLIDSKSDSFRYPFHTNDKPTLEGLPIINLREFKEGITPLIQYLDGVALAISAYQDYES